MFLFSKTLSITHAHALPGTVQGGETDELDGALLAPAHAEAAEAAEAEEAPAGDVLVPVEEVVAEEAESVSEIERLKAEAASEMHKVSHFPKNRF